MFNLIREVLQCAKWDRFFWWVNNISITQGVVGNNNLRVTFSTQCSALKQWLLIPHALLINILSGLDVIDGIDYEVKSGPKVVVEKLFIFLANSQLNGLKSGVGIHSSSDSTSGLTLVLPNVLLSEQELSVQVADFDIVIISDINFTVSCS